MEETTQPAYVLSQQALNKLKQMSDTVKRLSLTNEPFVWSFDRVCRVFENGLLTREEARDLLQWLRNPVTSVTIEDAANG